MKFRLEFLEIHTPSQHYSKTLKRLAKKQQQANEEFGIEFGILE
jgi:hypothetical protein